MSTYLVIAIFEIQLYDASMQKTELQKIPFTSILFPPMATVTDFLYIYQNEVYIFDSMPIISLQSFSLSFCCKLLRRRKMKNRISWPRIEAWRERYQMGKNERKGNTAKCLGWTFAFNRRERHRDYEEINIKAA